MSKDSQRNNDKTNDTNKNSLLNILKDAIIRSKSKYPDVDNPEVVLRKLKELKASAPKDDESLSQKRQWFKDLANTLLSLKFVRFAIKDIKDEIPNFWNQLTRKQQWVAASIAVSLGGAIAIGIYLGGIGVVLLGTGKGLSGIKLIIVLFILLSFSSKGLIDLVDFFINLVAKHKL